MTGFFFKVEGGKSRDFRCVWNEAWVYKEGFFFEAWVFKGWLFFLRHGFFCVRRAENLEGVIICSREEGKRIY